MAALAYAWIHDVEQSKYGAKKKIVGNGNAPLL